MSHTQTVAPTTMEGGQPVLQGQQPAAALAAAARVQQPQQPNLVLGQSETALGLFRSDSSPSNGGANGHSPQTPRAQQGAAVAGRDAAEYKDEPPPAQAAVEGEAAAAAAAGQQQPAPGADSAAAQQQPPQQQPAANPGANEAQEQAYRAAQQQMAAFAQQ